MHSILIKDAWNDHITNANKRNHLIFEIQAQVSNTMNLCSKLDLLLDHDQPLIIFKNDKVKLFKSEQEENK